MSLRWIIIWSAVCSILRFLTKTQYYGRDREFHIFVIIKSLIEVCGMKLISCQPSISLFVFIYRLITVRFAYNLPRGYSLK